MKRFALIIFSLFLVVSGCSKKQETKLEAFSPAAFAYEMGDSSEVDATVRVKGFQLNESNGMFTATLGYDIDLVTEKGDTIRSLISKVLDKSEKERFTETPIEIQFDLGPQFAKGKYQLIFRIKDAQSGQTATSSANFNIGD